MATEVADGTVIEKEQPAPRKIETAQDAARVAALRAQFLAEGVFALPSSTAPQAANESGWGPALRANGAPKVALSGVPGSAMGAGGVVPFAPFRKNDRLGRMSDFYYSSRGRFQQGMQARSGNAYGAAADTHPSLSARGPGPVASNFAYKATDDEESFSLVDNRPKEKSTWAKGKRAWNPRHERGGWRGRGRGGWRGRGRGGRQPRWGYNRWGERLALDKKDASIKIQEDWKLAFSVGFDQLNNSGFSFDASTGAQGVKDLTTCGHLLTLDPQLLRVTPKMSKMLRPFDKVVTFNVTASDDPVLARLASQKAGNIYATDIVLGVLMAATRSAIPWDLVIRCKNGDVWIDKRAASTIDFASVNENWNEVMGVDESSVNHPRELTREATLINQRFSEQCVDKGAKHTFAEPHPFADSVDVGQHAAAGAYRYRRFDLGDDLQLVARCTVNAYTAHKRNSEKPLFCTVRALNQFNAKLSGSVDWKQRLDSQTGAVLATEMKNNANKITRWVAEAELAGSDLLTFGFVSRLNITKNNKHHVLMCKSMEPDSFAKSLKIRTNRLWGSLRLLLQKFKALPDGDYVLLRDPNDPKLSMYRVPVGMKLDAQ